MTHGKNFYKKLRKQQVRWDPRAALTAAIDQIVAPAPTSQENNPPMDPPNAPHLPNPEQNPALQAQGEVQPENLSPPNPAPTISLPTSTPAVGTEGAPQTEPSLSELFLSSHNGLFTTADDSEYELPLEWKYIILKIQRLELQIGRLTDMYRKEQQENRVLRMKVGTLLGGHQASEFDEAVDACLMKSGEVVPAYTIPDSLKGEVDQFMAALTDPARENEREILAESVRQAIQHEKAYMSMVRLQTEAIRAVQEGGNMDVEKLMRMEGLSMDDLNIEGLNIPGLGDNKENEGIAEDLD